MATRIRLRRVGRKRQATFRIVVAGSMHARGGRVTEAIGAYNPRTYPSYIEINEDRALYWLRQGALPSESVTSLFRKAGVMTKLADGVDGEGVVTLGDRGGKTILADRPVSAKGRKKKAAKAEAATPEAPAAEPAAQAEPAVEAEAEPAAEVEPAAEPKPVAEAEAAPEAEAEAGGEEAAEPEAEAEKQEEES